MDSIPYILTSGARSRVNIPREANPRPNNSTGSTVICAARARRSSYVSLKRAADGISITLSTARIKPNTTSVMRQHRRHENGLRKRCIDRIA